MIKTLLDDFSPHDYTIAWLGTAFVLAFYIAYKTFPTILYVARSKHLMDEPDRRSMHSKKTPTFGGVGIFISLVVVMTIVGAYLNTKIFFRSVYYSTFVGFFYGYENSQFFRFIGY